MICFIDHNHLEALLRSQIDLLCLSHLFQKILHHHSVVVANIGGSNFEMVVGRDDVELEFAVASGLEHTAVDLDLLDPRPVESP